MSCILYFPFKHILHKVNLSPSRTFGWIRGSVFRKFHPGRIQNFIIGGRTISLVMTFLVWNLLFTSPLYSRLEILMTIYAWNSPFTAPLCPRLEILIINYAWNVPPSLFPSLPPSLPLSLPAPSLSSPSSTPSSLLLFLSPPLPFPFRSSPFPSPLLLWFFFKLWCTTPYVVWVSCAAILFT